MRLIDVKYMMIYLFLIIKKDPNFQDYTHREKNLDERRALLILKYREAHKGFKKNVQNIRDFNLNKDITKSSVSYPPGRSIP